MRSIVRALVVVSISVTLAIGALWAPAPVALAAPPNLSLSVTVIGDSYSAGNGAGAYISDDGSYRSRNSWGVVYTDWLKEQGVHTNVTSLAYSGSTTDDILNLQVPKVPSSADVVMFTAGGNDVHFEKIVTQCFAIAVRDPRSCRALVDDASTQLGKVKQDTTKILAALDSKLPDDAQVLLVGYPLLSLDQDYQLAQCYASSFGICSKFETYDAAKGVRAVGKAAEAMQKQLVDDWNKGGSSQSRV